MSGSVCSIAMTCLPPACCFVTFCSLVDVNLLLASALRAQPLDRIHHVRLLGQNRVAKFLRPVELGAHHRQDVRRRDQRLDAVIPDCLSTAAFSWSPLRFLFSFTQRSACTTSSG